MGTWVDTGNGKRDLQDEIRNCCRVGNITNACFSTVSTNKVRAIVAARSLARCPSFQPWDIFSPMSLTSQPMRGRNTLSLFPSGPRTLPVTDVLCSSATNVKQFLCGILPKGMQAKWAVVSSTHSHPHQPSKTSCTCSVLSCGRVILNITTPLQFADFTTKGTSVKWESFLAEKYFHKVAQIEFRQS